MNQHIVDFDNHIASMGNVPYSVRHNRMFHGPEWLNITAMQMCASEGVIDPEIIKFQPAKLYNVYYKNELNYGVPMYKEISVNKMIDIFKIHIQSMQRILNDNVQSKTGRLKELQNKYHFIPVGRTAVEYTFISTTELLTFYTIAEAEKNLDVTGKYINTCANKKQQCRGFDVTKRYVRLDIDGEVVEVLG